MSRSVSRKRCFCVVVHVPLLTSVCRCACSSIIHNIQLFYSSMARWEWAVWLPVVCKRDLVPFQLHPNLLVVRLLPSWQYFAWVFGVAIGAVAETWRAISWQAPCHPAWPGFPAWDCCKRVYKKIVVCLCIICACACQTVHLGPWTVWGASHRGCTLRRHTCGSIRTTRSFWVTSTLRHDRSQLCLVDTVSRSLGGDPGTYTSAII